MAYPKVTVVGAGNVGATTAQMILLNDLADVVLIDIVEGIPQGKALDMMHSRSILHFGPTVIGTNDYADTANSDIVVITAGVPRKKGMTREDLIETNAKIMGSVIEQAYEASPNAIFICVTNPLDVMVYLAYARSGLPKERIFGMGGVLDSSRFAFAIQQATGADIADIDALAVGAHGQGMVPLAKHSTICGKPITDVLDAEIVDACVKRAIDGGGEVVRHLKTGSAFYAPATSIAKMVKAILNDSDEVMSVCAKLDGEYGIFNLYMCVPVKLGSNGIKEIVELDLDEEDAEALKASAASIAASVDMLKLRG